MKPVIAADISRQSLILAQQINLRRVIFPALFICPIGWRDSPSPGDTAGAGRLSTHKIFP